MAKDKPNYEVVDEFNDLASQLIVKYPTEFYGKDVDKIRCVKITNKPYVKGKKRYELMAVKMPVLLDAPYSWYVTVFGDDWDTFTKTQKLLMIAEILLIFPKQSS
jgi:hypothetical protein